MDKKVFLEKFNLLKEMRSNELLKEFLEAACESSILKDVSSRNLGIILYDVREGPRFKPDHHCDIELRKEIEALSRGAKEAISKEVGRRRQDLEKELSSLDPGSWEKLEDLDLHRLKVPDGWLVRCSSRDGLGMTFYPDPQHKWYSNKASVSEIRKELKDLKVR